MKTVTYTCDLCREGKKKEDLLCLYWDSTIKREDAFGAYTLVKNLDAADKHICNTCLSVIDNRPND